MNILVFVFIFLTTFSAVIAKQANEASYQIFFDKIYRDEGLKFRSAQTPFKKNKGLPTRKGLDSLKFSASAQPSEKELHQIIAQIDPKYGITIVDLRSEKHAYLNGEPILWLGLASDRFIPLIKNKESVQVSDRKETYRIKIHNVYSEQELASKNALHYVQFPCDNAKEPSPKIVDDFITFIEQLDDETWVHLHCRQGWSRTTTFFVMVDMLYNADKVSKEDIFERQKLIGGANMTNPVLAEQYKFLIKFYEFSKLRKEGQAGSWSEYTQIKEVNNV